jgi:hypothetical protein
MTIGEERDVFNEISRQASRISYLEGLLYKYRKIRKTLCDCVENSWPVSESDDSLLAAYRGIIMMMPKDIDYTDDHPGIFSKRKKEETP